MGFYEINNEQKIRVPLSHKAYLTMQDDMQVFSAPKPSTFINTVFENYHDDAKSSISLYLQQHKLELDQLFSNTKLDNTSKKIVIDQLLTKEKEKIKALIEQFQQEKYNNKLYHINTKNVQYLTEDCTEDNYYTTPGQYIKCIIEEYCSLPFIKRERIYLKQIYEKVETACREHRVLKIKAPYRGKEQIFYAYPYKIMSDPLDTQSYLVCYSRKNEEEEKDKILASFSMARLKMPTLLKTSFHLTKKEITDLEKAVTKYSPAYLLGKPEEIHVRLTEKGKQSYNTRLYPRPNKLESLSSENEYVFVCSQQQAYDYFFPFGANAEILSPAQLRNKFQRNLSSALNHYTKE